MKKDISLFWSHSLNAGEVSYPPGGHHGPAVQWRYELLQLSRGSLDLTVDGAVRHLSRGHVCLLTPDHTETYQFSRTGESVHSWVALSAELVEPELKAVLDRAPFAMPITSAHAELVALILALTREDAKDYVNVLRELVKAALWLYARESLHLKLSKSRHAGVISAVRGYIRDHLGERFNLPRIARAAGTSPAQLIRLFRRHANTTPMEYAWRERTVQGLRLLEGGDLAVNRIAERVGFQTPFHFSARVKRETGVSPTGFRRRFRPDPIPTRPQAIRKPSG